MNILGLDISRAYSSSDVPAFELGQIAWADDGKAYQFAHANGALAVGLVVVLDETGEATPLTTTTSAPAAGAGLPVGVVVTALADNEYGWIQVFGPVAAINVATSCAVHTRVNSTASSGRVDDDATAGAEVIEGLSTTGAESSNSATGILRWPYVGATL